MTPLPANAALDRFFLEARSRILDLAAILDRIDRGGPISDPRVEQLQEAMAILRQREPARAERVQLLFSRTYDPNWQRPR